MPVSMRAVPAFAAVLLVAAIAIADDTSRKSDTGASPAGQPAAGKKDSRADGADARPVKLTKPWKDMSSLTEDQKQKINAIHRKAVEEVKAIEQREKSDIMALLSDQQKAELTSMQEKESAEKKTKAAQRQQAKPGARSSRESNGAPADGAAEAKGAGGAASSGAK